MESPMTTRLSGGGVVGVDAYPWAMLRTTRTMPRAMPGTRTVQLLIPESSGVDDESMGDRMQYTGRRVGTVTGDAPGVVFSQVRLPWQHPRFRGHDALSHAEPSPSP